jgi:hypothetical protein
MLGSFTGSFAYGRRKLVEYPSYSFYEAIGSTTAISTTQQVGAVRIYAESSTYDVVGYQPSRIVVNDAQVVSTENRGHTLVVLNPYGGVVTAATQYDTYIDPNNASLLAGALNSVSSGNIAVLVSYDASACNPPMREALNTSYGSTNSNIWTGQRTSHIFIGVKN